MNLHFGRRGETVAVNNNNNCNKHLFIHDDSRLVTSRSYFLITEENNNYRAEIRDVTCIGV